MGALSSKLRNVQDGGLSFWCAGCGCAHTVWVGTGPPPRWTWNGDAERPVFGPSVLVQYPRWEPPVTPENIAQWRAAPWEQRQVQHVCHTFVGCNGARPGEIIYLQDCTHALAGKTIPLPDMPSMRTRDADDGGAS